MSSNISTFILKAFILQRDNLDIRNSISPTVLRRMNERPTTLFP